MSQQIADRLRKMYHAQDGGLEQVVLHVRQIQAGTLREAVDDTVVPEMQNLPMGWRMEGADSVENAILEKRWDRNTSPNSIQLRAVPKQPSCWHVASARRPADQISPASLADTRSCFQGRTALSGIPSAHLLYI